MKEEALKQDHESDEIKQILLDATPLNVNLVDKNLNIIDCNQETIKLLGLPDKQEYLENFYDFSPEYQPCGRKSKEMAVENLKKAFDEGYNRLEWTHQTVNGEPIPCEVTLVRIKYKGDYALAGYARDLREIKAKESDVQKANERTQIIFDTAPISSMMFDKNFKILDCNYETVKMFRLSDKKIFFERFFDLSPAYQPNGRSSREMAQEENNKTFKEGYNCFTWMHQTLNGEPLPCEIIQVSVKFRGEDVIAGYVRDLREHHALLNEIKNDIERYRNMSNWYESLLNAMPFMVISQDLEEKCTYMNTAAESFLDKKWDEIVGTPCSNFGFSICNTEDCAINCAKRGRMRTHFIDDDNSYQIDTKLLEDLDGNTTGYIEVIQDITKTELLARKQAEAEASSGAKSYFLSSMSHEMRTPMNAIIGMAAVGKNAAETERKDYALKKIESAAKYLSGIISDILDMSKIEANVLELEHTAFDLNNSLHQAISLVQSSMDEKQIQFFLEVKKDTPFLFVGDDQRLTQVIMNLLVNAVSFTPPKGCIRLEVFLNGEENGICELRFEVADNGIGVAPEQQKKIFHAFEQTDSVKARKFDGTGLGLVITSRLVELMGGKIWVESEVGKGSRFIFTIKLPRSEKDAASQTGFDEKTEVSISDIYNEFKGKTLLIVEDIDINREVLISQLEGSGLNINIAANGRDALDMIIVAPDKYDLIFMDMQMPVMDGLEATKEIRALPSIQKRKLPIIAMTANVFQDDIDKCRAAGMDDHIGKPLNIVKVLEKLREYL